MKNPKIHARVSDLMTLWLDQIDVRNNAPYGSGKYVRAEARADAYENEASMLVFGDHLHTMTECMEGKEAE